MRVSSEAMTSALPSASTSRRDASPRLPIGVAARMITQPSCPLSMGQVTASSSSGGIASRRLRGSDLMRAPGMRPLLAVGRAGSRCSSPRHPSCAWSNLGHPHELVFDETYYVKDAYTLLHLGYEGSWPAERATEDFNAGIDRHLHDRPGVRRAPAARQVDHRARHRRCSAPTTRSAGGSRSRSSASCSCVVTMLIAHRLFRSTLLTVIAGGLLAIDGNAIVLSRVALLDTMLALFALLGACFVLLDRTWSRAPPARSGSTPASAAGCRPTGVPRSGAARG